MLDKQSLVELADIYKEKYNRLIKDNAELERQIDEAIKEIERLREEQEDTHALIERTGAILTATANALHGGYAPPDCLHSWHDLPELVEQLRRERDEARREVCRDEAYRPSPSPPCTANQVADRRGWDCFKENSNV